MLMYEPTEGKPLGMWQKWANEARIQSDRADRLEVERNELRHRVQVLKKRVEQQKALVEITRCSRDSALGREYALRTALTTCPELGGLEFDVSPGWPEWWAWWEKFWNWYHGQREAALREDE